MITERLRISAVHAMCRRSADALDFDPGGHFDCNAVGVAIKTQLKRGSEQNPDVSKQCDFDYTPFGPWF